MNPNDVISHKFGAILRILIATERRKFDLYSVAAQLMPAIRLDQVCIFEDNRKMPRAYAVWAYLSQDQSEALRRAPDTLLHASDWNEGENFWLMDLAAPHGNLRELLHLLARRAPWGNQKIHGLKRRNGELHVVELSIPRRFCSGPQHD